MNLQGKRVLVAGLARSGLAALRLLAKRGVAAAGMDQKITDDMRAKAAADGQELLPQAVESLNGFEVLVLSPAVPTDSAWVLAAKERGMVVIGEVELASYYLQGPIIGITGSNGKTTTTALIGHILRESGIPCQVGGNIGVPPTAMVESSHPEQWNVLELSSFQLETIETFRAQIGVCLNVTPDHLDRHHTFAEYAAAKARLFDTQREDGYAVLNASDKTCAGYAARTPAQVVWFSAQQQLESGAWEERQRILFDGTAVMLRKEIPLPGQHNVENTLAATAAARLAGASLPQIAAAVRSFPGVEHRLEFTRERRGVRYYNDSKATNVDATQKAIDAFDRGLWIILGGKDKDSNYAVLREPLQQKARAALLIGAAANKIAQQLDGAVPLLQCGDLARAVQYASGQAREGEIVLLAPACASFDQFENFEHRGRVFKELVAALPA